MYTVAQSKFERRNPTQKKSKHRYLLLTFD